MKRIQIYDTTLRDGTQGEGVSFSLHDKLAITERLDALGIGYVEGGYPASNPKDAAFFEEAAKLKLSTARLAAFGSTARPGTPPSRDAGLRALLKAGTPVVTIVAKSWDLHVKEVLRVSLSANLELIEKTTAYLKKHVDEVIVDAEHFFDGHAANPAYALKALEAAAAGGADLVCLCDTNGGTLPDTIAEAMEAAGSVAVPLGIHCHNDSGLAVANTLRAVECGAIQVQGTMNGFGERCGNTNLCTVIPNLQLKLGYRCTTDRKLKTLAATSRYLYELANIEPDRHRPYVGRSAFAHKAGLHVAAVRKNPVTYEHIDPDVVGNERRVLVSDLAGRSSVAHKAEQFGIDMTDRADELATVLSEIKQLESSGFQFEGAEASLELLMRKDLKKKTRFFRLVEFRVIDEKPSEDEHSRSEASVMIEGPDGKPEHTVASGNGPVNALDSALRKALSKFYPELEQVQLHDYKVRVLAGLEGTGSLVRVLIESGDGQSRWGTVGVSHNIVEASWQALVDSITYKLHKDRGAVGKRAS